MFYKKKSKYDHDPISNYVSSKEISEMCYMFQARETYKHFVDSNWSIFLKKKTLIFVATPFDLPFLKLP